MLKNDGISGGSGTHHPKDNYGEHQLSYLDQGRSIAHTIPGLSEGSQIDAKSHPLIKTSESSPPPSSATTSGSTSTPSSNDALSSGDTRKLTDRVRGSSASHFVQATHPQVAEGWPASVDEGTIAQSYAEANRNSTASSHEVSFPDASEGPYMQSTYPSAIKLLVTNNVAGSIIGRAGQTISELQTQSSARIKLSQTGDYYPGTQDRVCLVQGDLDNVKVAAKLLLERLHVLQEQYHSQQSNWHPKSDNTPPPSSGFEFVVRVLVPSTSCGMIIGKSGANIKHMEESSGVSSVRLSPKEGSDPNHPTATLVSGTGERIVTLTGPTVDSCLKCLCIILDGLSANHEICRYTNMTTSYSRLLVPAAYTPAQPGRSLLVIPPPTGDWKASGQYSHFGGKHSSSQPDLTHVAVDQQMASPTMPPDSPGPSREGSRQQYNHVFPEAPLNYSTEVPPMMPSTGRVPAQSTSASPMYLFPGPGTSQLEHPTISNSSSAPDLLELQFRDNMRISNPPTSAPVDYTHFIPQLPQPTPPGFTAQVLVPDTLIGSILGRGGKTLNELQMHSNTRIRISQRGEYVPGTKNRIVTIRGSTAHSVSLAQYLMSQRMVIPPTATYSPPGAPPFLYPSQVQPILQQHVSLQQQPPIAASLLHTPLAPSPQQQALHGSSFLPSDQQHLGSSAPASSSITLSRSSSAKDLPPQTS